GLNWFLCWVPNLQMNLSLDDVNQTSILWKKQGNNATMECRHTKGASYFEMYWFRQLPGENMERIVFTTTGSKEHDFGPFSTGKYASSIESGSLTVKLLQPEDSAVYFCAVSSWSAAMEKRTTPTCSGTRNPLEMQP
uniref:Ig-like domain-containing protein n=1 Tax=Salarias fasciatus TaxID=181472 RepID=A0A672JMK0_SALFA